MSVVHEETLWGRFFILVTDDGSKGYPFTFYVKDEMHLGVPPITGTERKLSDAIAIARRRAIARYNLGMSGLDWSFQLSRPTLTTIAIAFGVGIVTSIAWAAYTKNSIERTFGAGAERLRDELQRSGSALRAEIATLAADSAVEALRGEAADLGITAGMLADLQIAVRAAESVRRGARRAGETVTRYLDRLS